MAHEQSMTFRSRQGKFKGQIVNTVGIFQGQKITEAQADDLLSEGLIVPLGGKTFQTFSEAENAARQRSQAFSPRRRGKSLLSVPGPQ